MLVRAIFLASVTLVCALATPTDNPVAGRWTGHAPDPIGRTESVELILTAIDTGLTGVIHTAEGDIPLANIRLQGRSLTFNGTREKRGHSVVFHYDGTLSNDTIEFTVQNDDGSSFFRFTVHRTP